MATSPLPILLGVGALLLLKGKKKDAPTAPAGNGTDSDADVGGGAATGGGGTSGGSTASGSSGYANVSIAKMKVIQSQLLQLGFNPGDIDGKWVYGGNTYKAVKLFQESVGLEVDGKPGSNTQGKLAEMAGSGSSSDPGTGGGGGSTPGGQVDPDALPPVGGNEVGFSLNMQEMAIGYAWRIGVLDQWLNQQRLAGWLETKHNEVEPEAFYEAYPDATAQTANELRQALLSGVSPGGALADFLSFMPVDYTIIGVTSAMSHLNTLYESVQYDLFASESDQKKNDIAASGARAVRKFIQSHYVKVNGVSEPVKISDLPRVGEVVDLIALIEHTTAKFQKSTF